jgi:hypothetical protein
VQGLKLEALAGARFAVLDLTEATVGDDAQAALPSLSLDFPPIDDQPEEPSAAAAAPVAPIALELN